MTKKESKNKLYIDCLRGIAILGVIIVHSSQVVSPSSYILTWFMQEGARGVQLFYVASAITLCMSWVSRSTDENLPIKNFLIRRFFRIAPMFYFAIVLYTLIYNLGPSYWAPNGVELWFVGANFLFIHGFHPESINSVVPGAWSIAVEMTFYLVFPFLVKNLITIRRGIMYFFASLIMFTINLYVTPKIFNYAGDQAYLAYEFAKINFFGQAPVFFMGIISYLIIKNSYNKLFFKYVIFSFIVALILFFYPIIFGAENSVVNKILQNTRVLTAGFLFCIMALILDKWPISIFVNKILAWLGKLSYSMYIMHFVVIYWLKNKEITSISENNDINSIFYFFCVTVCTVLVSIFSFNLIEKPGINLGKKLLCS